MTLDELQKKFYYIQVRDQYEVVKAHDLLSKIGISVFPNNEAVGDFLKRQSDKKDPVKDNYLIKDGDGWRIQSHFIGTDNTIEELEEEIQLYLKRKSKSEMTDEERELCNKKISDLDKEIQSILCYVYLNYKDDDDIKRIKSELGYLSDRISSKFDITYKKFIKRPDFESTLDAFIREQKLNKIL